MQQKQVKINKVRRRNNLAVEWKLSLLKYLTKKKTLLNRIFILIGMIFNISDFNFLMIKYNFRLSIIFLL